MERYSGKSVSESFATGKIFVYKKQASPLRREAEGSEVEKAYLVKAMKKTEERLTMLYHKTVQSLGREQAMIFEAQKMILQDAEYIKYIRHKIDLGLNAEAAVASAQAYFTQIFLAMDDDYMKARAEDVKEVSERLIRILSGGGEEKLCFDEPVIVVTEELSAGEIMKMDKEKLLGLVTVKGSVFSHIAILAKSMKIPALVSTQIAITEGLNGKMAVLDGETGELLVEPKEEILKEMQKRLAKQRKEEEELSQLVGKESCTRDGRKIKIYANVGSIDELQEILSCDAQGIGLFRSEFLYLGRDTFPPEEELFRIYKEIAERMQEKEVIIRTLDIGADKSADYFGLQAEENPALGYRAIRICLDRQEIFVTQLRAIYRASVYGNLAVMFPMITSTEEVRKIKEISESVQKTLVNEGYKIKEIPFGIMIETPAAALISGELAKEVDFFSVGTNDLTQYTLAVDRQNERLSDYYNAHHPAVLKLIHMTVKNGHEAGISVGICGELAADTSLTEAFLDMGVDELSVSPQAVLKIRKTVRQL